MNTNSPRMTLIGGPTVLIRFGGQTFLTDPTFDPPGVYGPLEKTRGPAIASADVGHVDAVLLSHDQHPDNLDRAGRAMLERVSAVLSTRSAAERIPGVTGMAPGDVASIGSVEVVAVRAQHGPKAVQRLVGEVAGFVLRSPGWPTVYVTGDNSSVRVARRIAQDHPDIAVIVLHAGAAALAKLGYVLLSVNARRAAKIARAFPGALVIPVHAEDWRHFTEQPETFARRFRAAGLGARLQVLARGQETPVCP